MLHRIDVSFSSSRPAPACVLLQKNRRLAAPVPMRKTYRFCYGVTFDAQVRILENWVVLISPAVFSLVAWSVTQRR